MAAVTAKSSNTPARKMIAQNKKARHDYAIVDVFECGVVLRGTEVKSLRLGRASLGHSRSPASTATPPQRSWW
jgi:tmRNA-binding protein